VVYIRVKFSDITITKVRYCQYLGIFLDDTYLVTPYL